MNKQKVLLIFMMVFLSIASAQSALAQTLTSPNYNIPESYIGPGGTIDSSSPNYRDAGSTAGDIGTGNSSSTNYGSQSGFNTTNDPRLVVTINTSAVNFGNFSTSTASTSTSTFSVLNYTANGYGVYTIGSPPSNGSKILNGMSSTAASQVGVEQYGINLKANTSPISFGAEASQNPSGTFSFGTASTGYATVNNYRYVAGEKIAESVKSSGRTDYTISYIVNVATNTPGGRYAGSQNILVVGTY